MALPTNVNKGTVTGQFLRQKDGSPLSGVITFTPSVATLLDPTSVPKVVVINEPVEVALDAEGRISVDLVATDNLALSPQGWTWTVTYGLIDSRGGRVQLPNQTINVESGKTIDLAEVSTVSESNGLYVTRGDQGEQGIQGPPSWLAAGTITAGPDFKLEVTGDAPHQVINLVIPDQTPEQRAYNLALAIVL